MHSLKSYQRILVFLGAMIVMTCVLSPWLYASWDLLLRPWVASLWEWGFGYRPDLGVPFPRFFNRTFMIFGMLLFAFGWRWLAGAHSLRGVLTAVGFATSRHSWPDLLTGFGLAVSSVAGIAGLMTVAGVFHPFFQYGFAAVLGECLGALFAAFSVAFLEEFFFRGIVFGGFARDLKTIWSFIYANLFFAAIHFVKSPEQWFLDGIEPLAGIRNFVLSLHLFATPEAILPSFIGLFTLGVVLCLAFYRTGSLYLSVGLHAGWVSGIKSISVFGNYRRRELGWLFGKRRPSFLSGVVVWAAFIAVGLIVAGMTRRRRGLRVRAIPGSS